MSYIYEKCTEYDAIDRARAYGRLDQFEPAGWRALFDYLTELTEDTGVPAELDIIALCCDFQRFENVDEYNEQYGTDHGSSYDIEEVATVIDDGPAFICHAH